MHGSDEIVHEIFLKTLEETSTSIDIELIKKLMKNMEKRITRVRGIVYKILEINYLAKNIANNSFTLDAKSEKFSEIIKLLVLD